MNAVGLDFSDYLAARYARPLTNNEAKWSLISGLGGLDKMGGAHTSRDSGTSDFEMRGKPESYNTIYRQKGSSLHSLPQIQTIVCFATKQHFLLALHRYVYS